MKWFKKLSIMVPALSMFLALIPPVNAEGLRVHDPGTCTAIENHVFTGVDESFPASVGKIYAFTKIVGAATDTFVTHRWYYENKLMAEVKLPVRSSNWRTFSSKNIMPEWTGQWIVDIADEDGTVIYSLPFTVK